MHRVLLQSGETRLQTDLLCCEVLSCCEVVKPCPLLLLFVVVAGGDDDDDDNCYMFVAWREIVIVKTICNAHKVSE